MPRRSRVRRGTILGLLAIDAPAFALVAVVGHRHGYAATYAAINAWRLAHPVTFLPSVALAGWFVRRRWVSRRRGDSGQVERGATPAESPTR